MPPHERSRRRHGSVDPRNLQDLENPEHSPGDVPARIGWTKHQLMTAGELSGKGFDTLRKAARVKGPTHGGLRHIFSAEDLFSLIQKGESGKHNIQGVPAARAWRAFLAEAGIAMPEVVSRAKKR